jgi:hypothetical protein
MPPQCNHHLLHLRILETLQLAKPNCSECRDEIASWWDLTYEKGLMVPRVPELRKVVKCPCCDPKALVWTGCKCENVGKKTSEDEIMAEEDNIDEGESPVAVVESRNDLVNGRTSPFSRLFDSVCLTFVLLGLGYCCLQKMLFGMLFVDYMWC